MNVLFLSSWYPTTKNPNFGVFVKEHAKAIQTTGNKIAVLALTIEKSRSIFNINTFDVNDENGIRTIHTNISTRFKDHLHYLIPIQYFILSRIYKKYIHGNFKPDIIHSNVIYPAGVLGSWLANKLKTPHVITEHWSRVAWIMSKPILSCWARKAYSSANFILPVSGFLSDSIKKLNPEIPESKFRIIGNVIDATTFFYNPKTKNANQIHFCAIATWNIKKTPDKKPELFIEALGLLQKNINQKVRLTMMGGGDNVENLKQLCKEKNINAEFTGYIDKGRIVTYLQEADYFIHASTIETFGVVVAEALLCGTPVICSNVGALPQLVNKSNGILCNNTIKDWEEALYQFIKTDFDNKMIAKSIKNKYNLTVIGNEINDVYSTIDFN